MAAARKPGVRRAGQQAGTEGMLDAHASKPAERLTSTHTCRAQAPAPAASLHRLEQTTCHLPPHLQFDAWRDANASLVDYRSPSSRQESYEVQATTWCFGGLALMAAETAAGAYRRSTDRLRRDGLDLWCFVTATHGQRVYRMGDQVTLLRPGQLALHSLAEPFDMARTRTGWLHLYLPREQLPNAADGCRRLDTPAGRLLRDHLLLLAAELPRMDAAEAGRMAEATRAMIALATAPDAPRKETASAPVAAVQMARLRAIIGARLGAATFGPARLSQLSGISRSQLYRLFEPHGGVALFIQRERLAAAHRALSDLADPRSIQEIAEAVGLFDPSSFSRMFRRRFGVSPRELRLARSAGTLAVGASAVGGAMETGSLAALLRVL